MENDLSIYAKFIGKSVRIRICDNSEFKGFSIAMDAYLNIALESVLHCENGQEPRHYSSLFIKGSYIDHIGLDV